VTAEPRIVPEPGWSLAVQTTEPGWLMLPDGLERDAREPWVAEAAAELRAAWGELWQPEHDDVVPRLLAQALDDRAASPSIAVFQVWPIFAPVAAMCRITVVPTAVAPPWREMGGVLQPIEAAGLGAGLQWTHGSEMTLPDGSTIDMVSVHFAFDDGETTVIVGVDETLAALFVRMQPGLRGMLDTVRVERAGGSPFEAHAPEGFLRDETWPIEVP
jgi:hypothetical protein